MSEQQETQSDNAGHWDWRIAKLVSCLVIIASVLSCVAIAAAHSKGLTRVKVTAINPENEPRDHRIPLIKSKEALPDYEILIRLDNGDEVHLGTKLNTSAKEGLTWTLSEPIPMAEVAGVRLQDQDKLLSDVIAEVEIKGESVATDDYRFEFTTERSAGVGMKSFFRTPIGKAISSAIFLAVLLILFAALSG